MNLKSFLKRLFGGEVIKKFYSPVNGEILVVKEFSGKTVMRVGGIVQSGGIVEKIWQKSFSNIKYPISNIKTVLILGLGCGTVAELISKKWPEAQITGIEIDPEVIKIGKKYFGLEEILGLKIVIGDAIKKVTSHQFDLVLVDLYKGQEFPKEAESEEFLNGLKKILAKDGLVIFNRLYFGKHKKETEEFLEKLQKHSPKISLQKIEFNLFVFTAV